MGRNRIRIIPFYSTREHNSNDFDAKHFSRSTFTFVFFTNCQLVTHLGQSALKTYRSSGKYRYGK